ncbi:MAG: stage V sporulation protein AA [Lachnospiraceae bacterium]|nr:stage V sporulation protein AA [Lachnospiraceae bacterium]
MADKTIYLKMDKKVKMSQEVIRIGDLGKIYGADRHAINKIKTLKVHRFQESDQNRCVVGVLKIIELIQEEYPDYPVDVVGETECIIEKVKQKSSSFWGDVLKVIVVSALCFFGTIFTVMSYHNDINLVNLFEEIYVMVTGKKSDGFTVLEVFYSIGLSLGIIIFYNHIGKRSITKDPSPVTVEMRTYEDDVNRSLVEMANREEKMIDVD